jgi:hypothetical protein
VSAADLTPAARLRLLAESAPGGRVIVAPADVLAVLDQLGSAPARETPIPAPREAREATAGVRLAPTRGDAERLVRAAWEAEPGRVERFGAYEDADPKLTQFAWMTALDTLRILAGQPPQANDRPPTPACAPVSEDDLWVGAEETAPALAYAGADPDEEAPY